MSGLYVRVERSDSRSKRLIRGDRVVVVDPERELELDISTIVRSWSLRALMGEIEVLTLELLACDVVDGPQLALMRESES